MWIGYERPSGRPPVRYPPRRPHFSQKRAPSRRHFVHADGSGRDTAECLPPEWRQSFRLRFELRSAVPSLPGCPHLLRDMSVYGEESSAQDKYHQRCGQEGVGIGDGELPWIGKDGWESRAIHCPACDKSFASKRGCASPRE